MKRPLGDVLSTLGNIDMQTESCCTAGYVSPICAVLRHVLVTQITEDTCTLYFVGSVLYTWL